MGKSTRRERRASARPYWQELDLTPSAEAARFLARRPTDDEVMKEGLRLTSFELFAHLPPTTALGRTISEFLLALRADCWRKQLRKSHRLTPLPEVARDLATINRTRPRALEFFVACFLTQLESSRSGKRRGTRRDRVLPFSFVWSPLKMMLGNLGATAFKQAMLEYKRIERRYERGIPAKRGRPALDLAGKMREVEKCLRAEDKANQLRSLELRFCRWVEKVSSGILRAGSLKANFYKRLKRVRK